MTAAGGPPLPSSDAWRWIAIIGGGALGALLSFLEPSGPATVPTSPVAAPELHRTGEAPRAISLGGIRLVDTSGAVVPVSLPGTPAIVMVASVTCVWCERALADFAAVARGRVLTRLRMITIEGAAGGARMLAHAGVKAGAVVGPEQESARTMLSLQFPGTPVFVAVDGQGKVLASIPGYPGREALSSWIAVMLGERDAPAPTAAP